MSVGRVEGCECGEEGWECVEGGELRVWEGCMEKGCVRWMYVCNPQHIERSFG